MSLDDIHEITIGFSFSVIDSGASWSRVTDSDTNQIIWYRNGVVIYRWSDLFNVWYYNDSDHATMMLHSAPDVEKIFQNNVLNQLKLNFVDHIKIM